MTTITIIGSGNMTGAIGGRAAKHGHTVEVMARNATRAAALVGQIGNGATVGEFGGRPAGDVVVLAVPYSAAVDVVRHYGDALSGKIIVDITNPFNDTGTGLAIPHDTSIAQRVAEAAPTSARVVKAFNTLFGHLLAQGGPVDVFMAGDDAQAKANVSEFIESLGLRPRDTGDLSMAHWVEGAGVLTMGLARYGVGNFNFSLGINALEEASR